MIPTLKYVWATIKHKWFVFRAGLRVGVPLWQLIIHDWSKFTPAEAPYYGRQFFGDKGNPAGFAMAWIHHQNLNPHHWEYWIPRTVHMYDGGTKSNEPFEMPEKYIREMVADWMGASRSYEGQWPESQRAWVWFDGHFGDIRLHPNTRELILSIMKEAGVE